MNKLVTVLSRNICGVVILIFCPFGSAYAATYYIDQNDPTASDSNTGSKSRPWSSLNPTTEKIFSPGDKIVVRAGTYKRTAGSTAPLISPASSGQSGQPITFVSSPRHAAILDGDGLGQATVSISDRNHIVIDGFKIIRPGSVGIVAEGKPNQPIEDIFIQNNLISKVNNLYTAPDTDGIRLNNVIRSKISNNKINDIKDGALSANAAGIKLYNVNRVTVEKNDITNTTTGIYTKANGQNIELIRNFISNVEYAIKVSNKNKASIRYIRIANNILKNSELAIQLIPDGGTVDKVTIENNVLVGYSIAALQATQPGMGQIKIWNNIFDSTEKGPEFIADLFTYDDPPISIASMDYNLFTKQPVIINGLYNTNRRLDSLAKWKKYSEQDMHSDVGSARFKDANRNNFRLKSGSKAYAKGRAGGQTDGRKINIGAYQKNLASIGYKKSRQKSSAASYQKSSKSSTKQVAVGKKSTGTKSKQQRTKDKQITSSKSKTSVAAEKSQAASKTKTSIAQKNKETPAKVASNKTNNAKTTQTIKPEKTDNKVKQENVKKSEQEEIVVASVYPDAKPRSNLDQSKIEWDVRNALRYNGVCVLESNKLYFYDGHDNTGLKIRFLNDELYLLTKSNIDISFKDIGIKVGTDYFVHADSVVDEQTVLIKKDLPQLLSQLRQSELAKVQLRFWPTYPATQTYSEDIALEGFNEAYQEYKSCKKGN